MRVARKQAAAVCCGVALAALEVVALEIAQVRGDAARTLLLTKNKGKKMKKISSTAAQPNSAPENPAPAAAEPAPAASDDDKYSAADIKKILKSPEFMAGMVCIQLALGPEIKKFHRMLEVAKDTKNFNKRFLGGTNWCAPWYKKMNITGTWEVRVEPSVAALSVMKAGMKASKRPSKSVLQCHMFDVCCQEKLPASGAHSNSAASGKCERHMEDRSKGPTPSASTSHTAPTPSRASPTSNNETGSSETKADSAANTKQEKRGHANGGKSKKEEESAPAAEPSVFHVDVTVARVSV